MSALASWIFNMAELFTDPKIKPLTGLIQKKGQTKEGHWITGDILKGRIYFQI